MNYLATNTTKKLYYLTAGTDYKQSPRVSFAAFMNARKLAVLSSANRSSADNRRLTEQYCLLMLHEKWLVISVYDDRDFGFWSTHIEKVIILTAMITRIPFSLISILYIVLVK